MRLVRAPDEAPPEQPPEVVATIGNFDGVHLGHQYLLGKTVERAAELGVQSAVVTFDPHPRLVLRPHTPLHLLSTVPEKAELLAQLGVDHLLVWRFDKALQHTSAEQFLEQLNRRVRLRRLIHGPGFALGRRRQGTAAVIAEIGGWLGFEVEEASPFQVALPGAAGPAGAAGGAGAAAQVVSSTTIRQLIGSGRIRRAARLLGRPPTLYGVVVEGEKMGRTLGFPTANLRVDGPLAVPAEGVYAAWAELAPFTPRTRRLPAAVSIGTRPQFGGQRRQVEAYLLDYSGDLYGEPLRLHFVARVSGQERFTTLEALVAKIRRDVDTVRALLIDDPGADTALLAADG